MDAQVRGEVAGLRKPLPAVLHRAEIGPLPAMSAHVRPQVEVQGEVLPAVSAAVWLFALLRPYSVHELVSLSLRPV